MINNQNELESVLSANYCYGIAISKTLVFKKISDEIRSSGVY